MILNQFLPMIIFFPPQRSGGHREDKLCALHNSVLKHGASNLNDTSRPRLWSSPIPCAPCLPWILLLLLIATSSAAEFRVGFASADITPPVGWRRAGGFTELISTGVNDPLMTKAMVVQDGATTFAFVGNDLCSVPRDLTDLARLQASKFTGIFVANIVITATHTHGGPAFGADFPGHLQTNLTAAFGPRFVSIFGEGCAGDVNHLNPFNPDPQHWTNVSPAIGRAMAQVALTNLPYASVVKPGSFAVRSAVVMAPVTPISYTEINAAKKVMETLDQNGAAFLVVVDA